MSTPARFASTDPGTVGTSSPLYQGLRSRNSRRRRRVSRSRAQLKPMAHLVVDEPRTRSLWSTDPVRQRAYDKDVRIVPGSTWSHRTVAWPEDRQFVGRSGAHRAREGGFYDEKAQIGAEAPDGMALAHSGGPGACGKVRRRMTQKVAGSWCRVEGCSLRA